MYFNKIRISKKVEYYCFVIASVSSVAVIISRMLFTGVLKDGFFWVFGTLAFICWICWLYELIIIYATGYRYCNEGIVIKNRFSERRISREEIASITLSIAYGYRDYLGRPEKAFYLWNYPWITLSTQEPCHLTYNRYHSELSGHYIDRILKKDGDFLYGFAYNRDNKPDWIFKNYSGKIYITYSLLARYCDEFFKFINSNGISNSQIAVIYDEGCYKRFPRQIDFDYVDSRIEKELS